MKLDYAKLSVKAIVEDLGDTLEDLWLNTGEEHLHPLVERIYAIKISPRLKPSNALVNIMNELLAHDPDLLSAHAQDLMQSAVCEIESLNKAN